MSDEKQKLASCAGGRPHTRDQIKFFTIDDVAGLLGVSTRSVRRYIDDKELVTHKFGRAVRIAESDLSGFIAQHRCL